MGELLVLSDIGGDHPANLFVLEQSPQSYAVGSTVIGDDLQVGDPTFDQSIDKDHGEATDPNATAGDDRARGDVGNGLGRAGNRLVQHLCLAHIQRPARVWTYWSISPRTSGLSRAHEAVGRPSPRIFRAPV